ncbi:MAG: acyl carrier protein [Acidaminococcales bacterium]|jgi:hypothetical protein|nr:acyl carrier protein [Acidaminococcales bacterium]
MSDLLRELSKMVDDFGAAPKIGEMPRKNLADKGILGPTAAHFVEEVHTPLNFSYITFSTGTSAFQNIVGITHAELPDRIKASRAALEAAGLKKGDKLLVTYPPLVNVFSAQALLEFGLEWTFLLRSSRDAFLAGLYDEKPDAVIGESSFLRAAIEDAKKMNIAAQLPQCPVVLAAGTTLDLELLPVAREVLSASVHDFYGCQEFGWLVVDGAPVRDDIVLLPDKIKGKEYCELAVGGLPMGDSFVCSETGHVCDRGGKIITYSRERNYPELEVVVKASPLSSALTLNRLARGILRIKGRVVKVSPDVKLNAPHTVLELVPDPLAKGERQSFIIEGPEKTRYFDSMAKAQLDYQQSDKKDPVWMKKS